MPRRLRLLALAGFVLLTALLSAASTSADSGTRPPIVIAVEGPITGSTSATGVDIARGAALAVRQVNARGGVLGRRIVLVRGDDGGQASRAAATAHEIIAERPVAVIGPYNSSVGLVNLKIYRRAKVLPLWLTSSDGTRGAGITLQPMNSQIAPVEYAYARSIGARKVAMLVDTTANGAFTKGMAARLRQRLESHGATVVWIPVKETGEVGAGYYAEKVAAALAAKPDLVYSSTYFPEGAEIAKALRAAGPNPDCLMGLANVEPGFVTSAGLAASRRCVFSGVPDAPQLSSARNFVRSYRATFRAQPGVWGVFSYDSARLLFAAIRQTGSTSYGQLLGALRAVHDAEGQTGLISINRKTGYRTSLPFLGIMRVDKAGQFILTP